MYTLKLFIAVNVVIFKCTLGMSSSITKESLRKLLWNIKDERVFKRLMSAYLSSSNGFTVTELLEKRKTLEYLFSGLNLLPDKRRLILQVLVENKSFGKFLSINSAISLIESTAFVVYESRASNSEKRINNPLLITHNPLFTIAVFKMFLDVIHEDCSSYGVLKHLIHDCLINEAVEVQGIYTLLIGTYSKVIHRHLPELEKRYLYHLSRYGTVGQMDTVMDERAELRGILRFYMERYKNVNPNIKTAINIKNKKALRNR